MLANRFKKRHMDEPEIRYKAIAFITRKAQKEAFPNEYKLLTSTHPLPKDSKISALFPFIDSEGVIRVGGRLRHMDLPYIEKHPSLLPADHPVTTYIMFHCHKISLHQGRHITAATLRQAGWHILNQRRVIGSFLKNCLLCQRMRGKFLEQQMADLPPERLERTPPFTHTALDVFGPYLVHYGKSTRSSTGTKKTWVLICTCLYSRAIHMETLTSLDTSTVRLALRRFFAIRGTCQSIISDNGTNFIGARNEVNAQINFDALRKEVSSNLMTWNFIPPAASHFAGVWERKVGSVKRVLTAALLQTGSRTLSKEEFDTLIQETARIVNLTPLFETSSDPNDPLPVCPDALLTLRQESSSYTTPSDLKTYSKDDLLAYGKSRWRRIQYLADQFWVSWKRDYLQTLQSRRKWKYPSQNIKEGDIVLLRNNTPRNEWPMCRVTGRKLSRDGLVRSVTVVPANKNKKDTTPRPLERSIQDLVLLIPCETQ